MLTWAAVATPRFAALVFAVLVGMYLAGWVGLFLLVQFSRRAAESLVAYLALGWKLPTIALGLGLLILAARRHFLAQPLQQATRSS